MHMYNNLPSTRLCAHLYWDRSRDRSHVPAQIGSRSAHMLTRKLKNLTSKVE